MTPRRKAKLVASWRTPPDGEPVLLFSNAWTEDGIPVRGELHFVDGVVRLQELTFGPVNGSAEISSSTLRRIRLDEVLAEVRSEGETFADKFDEWLEDPEQVRHMAQFEGLVESARAIRRAGRAAAKQPPAGARGWGDDFYRMVAVEYIQMTREGVPGRGALPKLAERLAKQMGGEHRHRDNVRDWVAEARKRGFLVPLGRGRGGAVPGPRLIEEEEHDG